MDKAVQILSQHKLRKTPFRLDVLKLFLNNSTKGLTTHYIEESLEDFDRITLYRTLKTFEKSGVIHVAIDTSQTTKYALCHDDCTAHNHLDDHAHFLCNQCGETYCLENVIRPEITLPSDYTLSSAHLALSGICSSCNAQS
ncbi:MAG: transcriptional repressor [Saprospiraceae bacterium]|nr:transcriptional repressor [Saprospiraceae bacterium]